MAEQAQTTPAGDRAGAIRINRLVYRISRYWMVWFSLFYGAYVALPFLAPALMAVGWEGPARLIYGVYSFLCHQLPQRSYFLFGEHFTYPLSTIQSVWQDSGDFLVLRQFIGNAEMGWKVAWSDRMVWMYTSILVFAWIWYALRRRMRPLRWWGLVLLCLPMAIDGFSHMASDLAGLGQGFRDTNAWLAALTGNSLPAAFYAGDAWGSFNSIMRALTGLLFGWGVVWFGFPYLEAFFSELEQRVRGRFDRAGLRL